MIEQAVFRARLLAIVVLCLTPLLLAPRASAASKGSGEIAFIGTDDELYMCTGECGNPECITCPGQGLHVRRNRLIREVSLVQDDESRPPEGPARYAWPTFSPDGKQLAFAYMSRGPQGLHFGISVYDVLKHVTIPIFESRSERIIYVYWTPDSRHLSFLLGEPQGLSLVVAEIKEKSPVRLVLTGAPVYYDWNRTGDKLLVHTNSGGSSRNERVMLMNVAESSQDIEKVFSHGRAPFKAPCWSPDGKHVAYIANQNAEAYVVVADSDGGNPHSMASLPVGENALVWSPDSKHIAYSTAAIGGDLVFSGIKLLDIETQESKRIVTNPVQAFFFSPDAHYLAYVAVPKELPFYSWSVLDLKTGKARKLENFLATQDESVAYHYFDQLALSHTIWSPDSREFVYAGVRLVGEPHGPLGPTPEPNLWAVPVDGSKSRSIGPATIGFYSPANPH